MKAVEIDRRSARSSLLKIIDKKPLLDNLNGKIRDRFDI